MPRTKKEPEQPSQEEREKEIMTEAYKKGFIDGSAKVYKAYNGFLQDRMLKHFEEKNDELAKEVREIYLLNKETMKKPLT
jgi:effector-binding domain-containing protein